MVGIVKVESGVIRRNLKPDWDFTAKFNGVTETWTTSNATFFDEDTTDEELDPHDFDKNAATRHIWVDPFGAILSDTAWVIDFTLVVDALVGTDAITTRCQVALSDDTSLTEANQDMVKAAWFLDALGNNFILGYRNEGDWIGFSGTTVLESAVNVETYFMRMFRHTATTAELEKYTTEARTTIDVEGNLTITSTTDNLRYWKAGNHNVTTGTNTLTSRLTLLRMMQNTDVPP